MRRKEWRIRDLHQIPRVELPKMVISKVTL